MAYHGSWLDRKSVIYKCAIAFLRKVVIFGPKWPKVAISWPILGKIVIAILL
jgi:hypothetical protein